MSLLLLNGFEFPLTQANAEPVRAGALERGPGLGVRSGVRAAAWDLTCATGWLSQADARQVRGLVEGEGHVLAFDSTLTATSYLWSSRGAVPSTQVTPAVGGRVPGRWGGGALRVREDYQVLWPGVCSGSEWTVLAWAHPSDTDTGYWEHRTWRSDGAVWFNGVGPQFGYGQQAYVEGGALVLTAGTDTHQDWDEVVLLPYFLSDAWVAQAYGFHQATRWPPLPYVLASGAAVPGGAAEVQGQAGGLQRVVAGPGAWWESFDFTLNRSPSSP
ncbi:hypothetical protein [Archangium primigenium]|uniref:hypothetical protein n=1 Tax=[Archangium] primigenium TaxID=2792470 RepID=UPI00195C73E8|nr:hypothetical protein [Archangium primigenium]MBM7117645.1 hypothetical protein [Archangium primigenium]